MKKKGEIGIRCLRDVQGYGRHPKHEGRDLRAGDIGGFKRQQVSFSSETGTWKRRRGGKLDKVSSSECPFDDYICHRPIHGHKKVHPPPPHALSS